MHIINKFFIPAILCILLYQPSIYTRQEDEEVINYYQMEPLDDSLFIRIQEELFIEPVDPKAEIIVDLRDEAGQTIAIKGTLYPLLALSPELRARVTTYPFKLNLEEQVHYGSVFSRVIEKIKFNRIFQPPTVTQITSTLYYINPFFQLLGGERFGFPVKKDIGLSFGTGTPYSGPLETNFVEGNFHILGFKAGFFSHVDAILDIKKSNTHNNIYAPGGYQFSYVIPFGNFFEFGYMDVFYQISREDQLAYIDDDSLLAYKPLMIDQNYFNWEFRYPVRVLGSTRSRFYAARYLNELHFGFAGREMTVAGTIFDFRFDAMTSGKIRRPQYVIDLFVQRVFDSWAFSAVGIGPAATLSKNKSGKFGFISLFVNLRFKIGTSL
jgi:hypothetical protein